jgi:tRNA (guanine37-N1)-methyltransferase
MTFYIISLFPEMFGGVLNSSMLWKAQDKKLVKYELIQLRDFGIGPRKQVDDIPYGGGDGMVLKPEPLYAALEYVKKRSPKAKVILMTPRGQTFTQAKAKQLAEAKPDLIVVCGRYEGYDERVTSIVDEQISIGDYVLTGGELPAMVMIDSITRLVPGVLGGKTSSQKESFVESKQKEHPHYTRPEEFRGMKVPEILLSGNHAEIEAWRKNNRL